MTLLDLVKERYPNCEDPDKMPVVGMTDSEFRKFIIDYLIGDACNSVDELSQLNQEQQNEIALHAILERYSYRYWKEFNGIVEVSK